MKIMYIHSPSEDYQDSSEESDEETMNTIRVTHSSNSSSGCNIPKNPPLNFNEKFSFKNYL